MLVMERLSITKFDNPWIISGIVVLFILLVLYIYYNYVIEHMKSPIFLKDFKKFFVETFGKQYRTDEELLIFLEVYLHRLYERNVLIKNTSFGIIGLIVIYSIWLSYLT